MNRFVKTFLLAVVIIVGGWALYNRHEIKSLDDAWQLAQSQASQSTEGISSPFQFVKSSDYVEDGSTYTRESFRENLTSQNLGNQLGEMPSVRIASFKLATDSGVRNQSYAADICEQYDIVAIQNNSDLRISQLNRELRQRGLPFEYIDQSSVEGKFAILFRVDTVMLEGQHWYTVNDPENLFLHKPLVAWFRAINVPSDVAFTFTLANVQLNHRDPDREVAQLGQLFRAIRNDGRIEDDIIIAGDFYSSDQQIRDLKSRSGLVSAISGMATNTRNDTQLDNLIFDPKATVEFTGNSGVFDFMKRFNLTLVDAMSISKRMPIWAEFSSVEGRLSGRAAEAHWASGTSR